jgi:hypothetical protein
MKHDIVLNNLDEIIFDRLKYEADKQGLDLKTLVLSMIKQSLGLDNIISEKTYPELDSLSGTWTLNDYKEFKNNTSGFEKIDDDLWK